MSNYRIIWIGMLLATITITGVFFYKLRALTISDSDTNCEVVYGEEKTVFLDGDLVVKSGRTFISELAKTFNPGNSPYSHCGIIIKDQSKDYVVHCMGDESSNSCIRITPLSSFIQSSKCLDYAIYRFELDKNEREQIKEDISKTHLRKPPFDTRFDLESEEELYCSEFVWKTYSNLKGTKIKIPLNKTNDHTYISIENLYNNKFSTLLKKQYSNK